MGQGVVEIQPRELQFTFELKKQSSCSVHLINKSNEYVAFKVKTTSPKRYCVRPNIGVILPRSTCDFTVTMQAQRTAPPDMQLKDKFLVQTTVVPSGTSDEDLSPFFSKETNGHIDESKLRVVLVDASHRPVEQLINGVPNTDAAVEVPVLKDTQNVENEVPALEKEVPPHQEHVSAGVTHMSSPLREIPIPRDVPVQLQEQPAVFIESPAPLKNKPSPPPKYASSLPVEDTSVITIEQLSPMKENTVSLQESLLEGTLPKYESSLLPKYESSLPAEDTSVITIEQLSPMKENTVSLQESLLEGILPKEAVTLRDRGLFSVQTHELSHVTEDVQNLKSKLNNLESKLEGAEKMIIKLREESRTTTQERDKLQQEMLLLPKNGTPKSQIGFPLLFVVYVALIGTSLGYLLRL